MLAFAESDAALHPTEKARSGTCARRELGAEFRDGYGPGVGLMWGRDSSTIAALDGTECGRVVIFVADCCAWTAGPGMRGFGLPLANLADVRRIP